jgi:YHS domain-containing protein/TusA-related sulfurtransferase
MNRQSKILAVLLAVAFVFALSALAQTKSEDTAKDPVCGMSVKKAGAKLTSDYKGTTYYFCSESCQTEFAKNPDKYLENKDMAKHMGGMRHMEMKPGEKAGCDMANCPMMLKDLDKKIENTKDGVIITLTSKNPETVKKIQEHAAMMKEGKCCLMGKSGGDAKTGKEEEGCPMAKKCPMKDKKK